jgi:hypothetical protein
MTNAIMCPYLTREESGELEDHYMGSKKICRWYNETSGVKRAYDLGLIEKKWVEEYCWEGGTGCVRKKRFEEEGYVSPDYVLPNGAVSERVKKYLESKGGS